MTVIAAYLYRDGRRVREVSIDEKVDAAHRKGEFVWIGIADPTNTRALDEIKFAANLTVEPILVDEEQLRRGIEQAFTQVDNLNDAMGDDEGLENLELGATDDDDVGGGAGGVDAKGDDTPVVKFVNKVLLDAIRRGASDIHFEPYEGNYRVRYRLDGVLRRWRRRRRRCRRGSARA